MPRLIADDNYLYAKSDPCDAWPADANPFSKLVASLTIGNEIDIEGIIESVSARSAKRSLGYLLLEITRVTKA